MRLETMPSRCMRQADCSTASPPLVKCSTKRSWLPVLLCFSSSCQPRLAGWPGAGRAGLRLPQTADRRRRRSAASVLPSDRAACSAAKSGAPLWSRAQTSPSRMQSGSLAAALAMAANLLGPVQALAGEQPRFAVLHPQLHAIAVELDFMHPVRCRRAAAPPGGRVGARRIAAAICTFFRLGGAAVFHRFRLFVAVILAAFRLPDRIGA